MRQHYTLHQYVAALHSSAICGSTTHFGSMQYTRQLYAGALHASAVCGGTTHFSSMYCTLQRYATALHCSSMYCTLHQYAAALRTSAVCTTHFSSMRQHYKLRQYVPHTFSMCGSTTRFSSMCYTLQQYVLHPSEVCTTHFSSMRQHYTLQQYVLPQQYTATLHTSAVCGSTTHFSSVYYELRQH